MANQVIEQYSRANRAILRGIYGISSEVLMPYDIASEMLLGAIDGGLSIFQLRDKSHSDSELYPIAKALQDICIKHNVLFVINDRVELALKIKSKALHIGENDGDVAYIRRVFNGILGVSSYGDIQKAKELEILGADYVAFGAFFASSTKPTAKLVDIDILHTARQKLQIPICAIGGISNHNISLLKNADMHAVISYIWHNEFLHTNDIVIIKNAIKDNVKALQTALLNG